MKVSKLSFYLTAYSLTNALAASIPATFNLTTSSNADANIILPLLSPLNLTLSSNLALENSSSNRLPPDPYYYTCPGSSAVPAVIIKFFAYGQLLGQSDTAEVLARAIGATSIHQGQMNIRTHILKYEANNVILIIHSKSLLTWGMLGRVVSGIWEFVNRYEYVDFDFDVGAPGVWKENVYGTGALTFRKAALS